MKGGGRIALVVAVLLLGGVSGFFIAGVRPRPVASAAEPPPGAQRAAAQLLALSLPDVQGVPQPLRQWQGKLLVVNFWATWCSPCREEIPGFSRLQQEYAAKGVQFVGIALDSGERVGRYARQKPTAYPLLVASPEPQGPMSLMTALGNRTGSLPFTVIIGRDGVPRHVRSGLWRVAALEPVLAGAVAD